jgi:ketosteroid isomerase-like protein
MKPSVDSPGETQAIREVSRALLESEQNRDLAATMAFFTEETVIQAPGAPQIQGLNALRGFLEELFQTSMGDFDSAPCSIVLSASGDMACDIGWFRMPSEGSDGPVVEQGKYTIVWRKVDGEWKYLVGCFNYDESGH